MLYKYTFIHFLCTNRCIFSHFSIFISHYIIDNQLCQQKFRAGFYKKFTKKLLFEYSKISHIYNTVIINIQ